MSPSVWDSGLSLPIPVSSCPAADSQAPAPQTHGLVSRAPCWPGQGCPPESARPLRLLRVLPSPHCSQRSLPPFLCECPLAYVSPLHFLPVSALYDCKMNPCSLHPNVRRVRECPQGQEKYTHTKPSAACFLLSVLFLTFPSHFLSVCLHRWRRSRCACPSCPDFSSTHCPFGGRTVSFVNGTLSFIRSIYHVFLTSFLPHF